MWCRETTNCCLLCFLPLSEVTAHAALYPMNQWNSCVRITASRCGSWLTEITDSCVCLIVSLVVQCVQFTLDKPLVWINKEPWSDNTKPKALMNALLMQSFYFCLVLEKNRKKIVLFLTLEVNSTPTVRKNRLRGQVFNFFTVYYVVSRQWSCFFKLFYEIYLQVRSSGKVVATTFLPFVLFYLLKS